MSSDQASGAFSMGEAVAVGAGVAAALGIIVVAAYRATTPIKLDATRGHHSTWPEFEFAERPPVRRAPEPVPSRQFRHETPPGLVEVGTYVAQPLGRVLPIYEAPEPHTYEHDLDFGDDAAEREAVNEIASILRSRRDVTNVRKRKRSVTFQTRVALDSGMRSPLSDAITWIGGTVRLVK